MLKNFPFKAGDQIQALTSIGVSIIANKVYEVEKCLQKCRYDGYYNRYKTDIVVRIVKTELGKKGDFVVSKFKIVSKKEFKKIKSELIDVEREDLRLIEI